MTSPIQMIKKTRHLSTAAILSVAGFFALTGASHTAIADSNSESVAARSQLKRQIALIDKISPFVEREDIARLLVLKSASDRVIMCIRQSGLGNMDTVRSYQHLIVAYRYSESFFKMIESERIRPQLAELLSIQEAIARKWGFDDSPYTRLTAHVYSQIEKLIRQVIQDKVPLPRLLSERLQDLLPSIGKLTGYASRGDRPNTFAEAKPVYESIRSLYPMFDEVASTQVAYSSVLEIQGLNEFYAEFADM